MLTLISCAGIENVNVFVCTVATGEVICDNLYPFKIVEATTLTSVLKSISAL